MGARELRPDEVDVFKSLRLRALATDPAAFSSRVERERAFTDDEWARRIRNFGDRPGAVFADFVDGAAVGMSGVGEDHGEAMLWGMWVDPPARGGGVGHRLIDAAASWAASIGCRSLGLWVLRGNTPAIELYRRAGFAPAVDGAPPAPAGCDDELFMRRPL